jgi:hypothetical protein
LKAAKKSKRRGSPLLRFIRTSLLETIIAFSLTESSIADRICLKTMKRFLDKFEPDELQEDSDRARLFTAKVMINHRLENEIDDFQGAYEAVVSSGTYGEIADAEIFGPTTFENMSRKQANSLVNRVMTYCKYEAVISTGDELAGAILGMVANDFDSLDEYIKNAIEPHLSLMYRDTCMIQKIDEERQHDFDLSPDSIARIAADTKAERNSPFSNIMTGVRALNRMLGGDGFQSGRVYCFAGVRGKWKSGLLLNCAMWANRYNRIDGDPRDEDGKIPAALYITLENDRFDTFERIISNKCGNSTDIKHAEVDDIVKGISKGLGDTINEFQVFFKYRKNRSITALNIEAMMEEMLDDGYRCRLVVVDYLNRLEAVNESVEERMRLGNISNELSAMSKEWRVPVVTATQLNRQAIEAVEKELSNDNEKNPNARFDKVEKFGSSMIAESKQIEDNVDSLILIYPETADDGTYWLGFKNAKQRGKESLDDEFRRVFYHPFAKGNTMRLEDDVEEAGSISKSTLKDNRGPNESREAGFKAQPDVVRKSPKNSTPKAVFKAGKRGSSAPVIGEDDW